VKIAIRHRPIVQIVATNKQSDASGFVVPSHFELYLESLRGTNFNKYNFTEFSADQLKALYGCFAAAITLQFLHEESSVKRAAVRPPNILALHTCLNEKSVYLDDFGPSHDFVSTEEPLSGTNVLQNTKVVHVSVGPESMACLNDSQHSISSREILYEDPAPFLDPDSVRKSTKRNMNLALRSRLEETSEMGRSENISLENSDQDGSADTDSSDATEGSSANSDMENDCDINILKMQTVDRLMVRVYDTFGFHGFTNCAGGVESASISSSATKSGVSSITSGQTGRKRNSQIRGDQSEDRGDKDDQFGKRRKTTDKPEDPSVAGIKRLACPYFKRDAQRCHASRACRGPGWHNVSRIKSVSIALGHDTAYAKQPVGSICIGNMPRRLIVGVVTRFLRMKTS
jgi:hypothetical protein